MKILKIVLLSIMATGLLFSFAFAAGDVAKGKALFNDTKLGGNTSGKSLPLGRHRLAGTSIDKFE